MLSIIEQQEVSILTWWGDTGLFFLIYISREDPPAETPLTVKAGPKTQNSCTSNPGLPCRSGFDRALTSPKSIRRPSFPRGDIGHSQFRADDDPPEDARANANDPRRDARGGGHVPPNRRADDREAGHCQGSSDVQQRYVYRPCGSNLRVLIGWRPLLSDGLDNLFYP